MSLTLLKSGTTVQLLNGDLPENQPVKVFTEQEVLQFEGWKQWISMTDEQREDMLAQATSHEYQQWMEEDDWDECRVRESNGLRV